MSSLSVTDKHTRHWIGTYQVINCQYKKTLFKKNIIAINKFEHKNTYFYNIINNMIL